MVPPVKRRWSISSRSSSAQHTPAVHVQHFTGEMAGQIAAQKQNGPRDVLGGGDALERDGLPDALPVFRRECGRAHLGVYPSRSNAVDLNVRCALDGE